MHFLETFSSKIHRQVEFLLETQINLGAPSGAVCLEPAAAMLHMLTLVMFNFCSTKLWERRDQNPFVGTSDTYLPTPR